VGRRKALTKLLPYQRSDFEGIFAAMEGLPVTIRLLDPPLHEFLPNGKKEIVALSKDMHVSVDELKDKIESLEELNPMLGFRGCRLGMVYPEISEMQVQAIFQAACKLTKSGKKVHPEVMIPVLGHVNEMKVMRELVAKTAKETMEKAGIKVPYHVGVMIELPRAVITADEIAEHSDFFSFGTNDLTQTTFGYSRDDAGKFIPKYVEMGVLEKDPFQVLDQKGVGQLVRMGVERGRKNKPNLKIGICGEHGGEPSSVEFCHRTGLNYVSCSPYRVPIARLAAAHAVLKERK
jgi:pyruvate,orthophosphate dikinase